MSWKEFCLLPDENGRTQVAKWYQEVDYRNLKIPQREDGECYKEICKSFLKKPMNLVLTGQAGRGKTHFSYCLLRGLFDFCHVNLGDIRFFKSKALDDRILREINIYHSAASFLSSLAEVEYLFIDDFGIERDSERTNRDYYELLDARLYECKTTVISTNLSEEGIAEHFKGRIYSRLKEFIWMEFDGPDLRGGRI